MCVHDRSVKWFEDSEHVAEHAHGGVSACISAAGEEEGSVRSEGCADHDGQGSPDRAGAHATAEPSKPSSLQQACRPISRGSLLDGSIAAQHRLEIGICAVERPDGEEILQVLPVGKEMANVLLGMPLLLAKKGPCAAEDCCRSWGGMHAQRCGCYC